MASADGGGEPRLGLPFLVEISTDRHWRTLAIIQETRDYLTSLSAIMPLLETASALPQNAPKPKVPEPLECLEWAGRVDKWGLLNPGTWLDQPKWFMEDIRAVSTARSQWRDDNKQDPVQGINVPEMTPGITR